MQTKKPQSGKEPAQRRTAGKRQPPTEPQTAWDVFEQMVADMQKNGPIFSKSFQDVESELSRT